ncbi:MAG: hypothetical protein ACWA5A_04590 [Marinibacterium sp.]
MQTDQLMEELQTGLPLTDLAFDPNGNLYGITANALYSIDLASGGVSLIGDLTGYVTPFINVLNNATGFDISQSGDARISSADNSIVVFVDLATGTVSNPYGTSLGQGQTAAGDIIFTEDGNGSYWASTDWTIEHIMTSTVHGEISTDDEWVGDSFYGLAAAPTGITGLVEGEILGLKGDSIFRIENGSFGLIPHRTFNVSGNISGAAQTSTGVTPTPPPLPIPLDTLPVIEKFDDGVLNGGNWSYGTGTRVQESGGVLGLYQDKTDDGGHAIYTLTSPTANVELVLEEFHHASANYNYYFGGTSFNFEASDGSTFSVRNAMLRSSYGPDYGSDPANYDHPRLQLIENGNRHDYYDFSNTTTSLLDTWVTTKFAIDNTTGIFSVDNLGDGDVDISFKSSLLVDAKLVSIGMDGYGWYTGHYRLIDTFELSSTNPNPPSTKATAKQIFNSEGKMAFLADLALAAYHLDLPRESTDHERNDFKPTAENAFDDISKWIDLLDSSDIPIANTKSTKFGTNGFENGIFTKKNAAALVGRSEDALFISFRGTNDNEGQPGFPLGTPDERDWPLRPTHYALFKELRKGIKDYINDQNHIIDKVYVTGHSLGAAMVEAFLDTYSRKIAGAKVEAITFANPGYEVIPSQFGDSRAMDVLVDGDPIDGFLVLGEIEGEQNTIYHNLLKDKNYNSDDLHRMDLYSAFIDFMQVNGIGKKEINGNYHGVFYDSIYIDTQWTTTVTKIAGQADIVTTDYKVGKGGTTIKGGDDHDIILGGKGDDTLKGGKGVDHIDGGTQNDAIYGGKDGDFLYGGGGTDDLYGGRGMDTLSGGKGADDFVFHDPKETHQRISKSDKIIDFESRGANADHIDLSEMDADIHSTGYQPFDFIGTNDFSGKSGELRYFHNPKYTIVQGDVDGDGSADFSIRLSGSHDLLGSHFYILDPFV